MINDQLRELRVRLDQIERIALVIPTKYWPDAFEAVLQGCEIMVGIAERELDQDFSTKDRETTWTSLIPALVMVRC